MNDFIKKLKKINEKSNLRENILNKIINKNQEQDRTSVKKSTISLSEIPNIIKDEINSDTKPKKSFSNIFERALLYPTKLKKSFIYGPIKASKDETPSSLAEIKKLVQMETKEDSKEKERKNKSITKKEKLSKKFLGKNIINGENQRHISQKKIKSTKQGLNNNLEIFKNKIKENNGEKEDRTFI